jgi:hypothetical protein
MEKLKPTQGVMIHVQGDVDRFIGDDTKTYGIETYKTVYNSIKDRVAQLSAIEELVLQFRCISEDNLKNIKLSTLREYVYARCPFYRRNKSTKDIRVIVSRIDIIDPENPNPSLDDLYKNKAFMDKASEKLIVAMRAEYEETGRNYFELYD